MTVDAHLKQQLPEQHIKAVSETLWGSTTQGEQHILFCKLCSAHPVTEKNKARRQKIKYVLAWQENRKKYIFFFSYLQS